MNKIMIATIATLISTAAVAVPLPPERPADLTPSVTAPVAPTEVNGCAARATVEKVLNDGEFVVLTRGHGKANKVVETWINSKGSVMTVSYDEPADKQQTSIKTVCVDSVATKSVYNGDTVEILYKSLEKASKSL